MKRFRFTVRKQSSGYAASVRFYVYDTVGKGRVTVGAHILRDAAEAEAEGLNVTELMTEAARDPRPYDVRRAEAAARYAELKKAKAK